MTAPTAVPRRLMPLRLALWSALPLVLLAAAGWLLHSEAGLRFALARAAGALEGGLTVAAARGTLAGPLELEGLALRIGGSEVEVARLALDLRSTPLLLGRLHLLRLEAEGVRVAVAPDPAAPPFVLPERIELPLHLALERFAIRDLEVRIGDAAPLAVASVSGAASADARGLRFEDLAVEHARGALRGRGSLGLAQPYPLEAALALELTRPDQGPLLTSIALDGRLEALRARSATAAPLALRADLTLHDAFSAPRLAGRIDCDALQPAVVAAELAAFGPATLDCALEVAATAERTTATGRLRLAHPEWRPAVLDLTLAATPETLTLERGALRFEGAPTTASIAGRIGHADPALPFTLEVEARELGVPTRAPGPVLVASASFAATGDRDRARATLELRDRAAGVVTVESTLAPRSRRFALDATARDLVRSGITLVRATLHAEGDAAGAALEAAATLRAGGHAAELDAHGRLTPSALALDELGLALLGGRIDGAARFDFGGSDARGRALPPRWHATLAARGLDPRALDARFRGQLAARATIDGTPAATRIALTGLSGTLRDRAIGGAARFRFAPLAPRSPPIGPGFAPQLALDDLTLTSGAARVEAAFDAGSARFLLDAPDLSDLLPTGRGRLVARAAVADGGGTLTAEGTGLTLGPLRLAALSADVAVPPHGAVSASVVARALDVGDLAADEIVLGADGPREALTLTLEARAGQGRLGASARGALGPRAFVGTLERLEVAPAPRQPEAAVWALAAPAALGIGHDGLRVAEACLADGRARGCLGGAWHPAAPWRIAGQVERLTVGTFGALLARGLDYRGTLDLEFVATGHGPTVGDSHAVLALSSGRILQPPRRAQRSAKGAAPPAPTTLLDFEGGRIELARKGQRNALEARFALTGGGHLNAALAATGTGPFAQRALSGRLQADVSQFALLPALLPELKSLTGRVTADVAVTGTVGEPGYSGRLAFEDGSAALPQYGLELSEIGAELVGDGEALAFSGSARSGGVLRWRADMKRSEGRWRANGRLWGERVEAIDTPEARVLATPALVLDLDGNDLKVSGEVVVPKAKLAPRTLTSAVQATGDEVIVDPDHEGTPTDALRIDARVRLKLGDEVEFDGFGLTAKVRGEITVTERPGALAIASGELALVDGKYEAYGQDLTIERGQLLFSGGPVANPGLNVRAKRTVERPTEDEDVVVGIDVRGTLRSPETTIFATPAMSSSDALAYLVVGRPLADSTDAEQSQLSDAASSMKLSGGEFLAQQVGRRIGLDEVRVADADDPEEAQLWLGTYLSPRLFVSYGMGLFEQFHTARVRYTISSKWSVEAESGRESSADFKYTIER